MAVKKFSQLSFDNIIDEIKAADDELEISSGSARESLEGMVNLFLDGPQKECLDGEDRSWFRLYLDLARKKMPWRLAAYIAWASVPKIKRWPATQIKLARDVLGLRSDRVLIRWREENPEIDAMIAQLQDREFFEHRAEVLKALAESAGNPNYKNHQDRRLYLEMSGDHSTRIEVDDKRRRGKNDVAEMSDEELLEYTKSINKE
jgi:hypothetical protein